MEGPFKNQWHSTDGPIEKPTSGYGAFSPEIGRFLKEHLLTDLFQERQKFKSLTNQKITMKPISIGITILLFASNFVSAQQASAPEVKTASGVVKGALEEDVAVFKGIPYAAPPVGENRWRPPQPVTPWKEVRDASKFCADCPQPAWSGSTATYSEDCLFLNVWAPASATKNQNSR